MSYGTSGLKCMVPGQGTGMPALWSYTSTDVHTDVDASDYFTDGYDRGMHVGDYIFVRKTSATIGATLHSVETVTANGAATISPAILA